MVREVYNEVINRAHYLIMQQINDIDETFNRLQKLSLLKFLPQVKKDVKDKLSKATVNSIVSS